MLTLNLQIKQAMLRRPSICVLLILMLITGVSWSQSNLDSLQTKISSTLDSAFTLRQEGEKLDLALEMIDSALYALNRIKPIDYKLIRYGFYLKGLILTDKVKYIDAFTVLDSAIHLSKICHQDTGLIYAKTLRNFGVSCLIIQKASLAFIPIKNSIDIFEKLNKKNDAFVSTTSLIEYYIAIQKNDSAIYIINQIDNAINSIYDESSINFYYNTAREFFRQLGIDDKVEIYDELISKLTTTSPYDRCLWKINHLMKPNNEEIVLNFKQVYELIECSNSYLKNDTILFAGRLNQLADIIIRSKNPNFFLADSLLQVEANLLNIENLELQNIVNKDIFESAIDCYLEKCQMAVKDSNITLLAKMLEPLEKLTNGFTNFQGIKNSQKELILIYTANYYFQIKDSRLSQLLNSYKTSANQNLDNALKFMTETELNQFIQNELFSKIDLFFSLYNADLLEESYSKHLYEQALKSKGLLFRKTKRMNKFFQESKDSAIIALKNKWQNINEKINSDHQLKSDSLYKAREELERKISKLYSRDSNKEIFSIDTLQYKLKKNEISVEFVKYKSIFGRTKTEKYMAIVLDHEHAYPKVINLFNETQFNSNSEFRSIEIDQNNIEPLRGYGLTPVKKKNLLHFKLIWEPILNSFPNTQTIYYSTVGLLNQINLSTILFSDTSFMFDQYKMIQLSSTYDITEQNELNFDHTNKALLIGGINYGSKSQTVDSSNQFNWNYLNGTLDEVKSINKIMLEKNISTTLLINELADATSVVKKMSENQNLIHIATHGYYNNTQDIDKLSFTKNNPLSRSVLVLANANVPDSSNNLSNNAYLNAYQISNLDLTPVKLVVLSACESALGDNINQYESNFSLIRGFKIAGAKSIISTLWPISDNATQNFMQIFYKHLLIDGLSLVDSFTLTQKNLKSSNKSDQNWSAFILIN